MSTPPSPTDLPSHSDLTQGFSITEYDPFNPRRITEPASRQAMSNLCILNFELKMPTSDELSSFPDPASRQTVLSHHHQRISHLLTQIQSERDRILSAPTPSPSPPSANTSAIDAEQRQLAKLKLRHQREVEHLITTLLTLDALQKDSAARDLLTAEKHRDLEAARARERHLKHVRDLEIADRQKLQTEKEIRQMQFDRDIRILEAAQHDALLKVEAAKRAEAERRERAEKNRERIAQIEQNKQLKIVSERRRIEEKEGQRLALLKAEKERRQTEKAAVLLRKKQQIEAAKEFERELLERKRHEGELRDLQREEQLAQFEIRKKEEKMRMREREEEKKKRFGEAKVRLEEADMKRKKERMTSDLEIRERVEKRKQMIEKRSENARLQRSDQAVRGLVRAEQWKMGQERKYLEMKANEEMKEEHVREAMVGKEKERRVVALERKLKQEERLEAAERLERTRELRTSELQEKVENSMGRVEKIQAEIGKIERERKRLLRQLQKEKESMKRLAELYGIDLSELEKRSGVRSGCTLRRANSISNLDLKRKGWGEDDMN